MTPHIQAIHNITHYSAELIEQTIALGEGGQLQFVRPGEIRFDIWLIYRVIREYERVTDDGTT